MAGLENISFDDTLTHASVAEIFEVKIPFRHINHLIKNKKATNRPKDMIEVIELEKIIKVRDQKKSLVNFRLAYSFQF